uniref:DUF5734 domain-containing protein n=1 Tax=Schistocephalus solidus TaxID=70667 RepID=A0A0V0JB01_SCHSO
MEFQEDVVFAKVDKHGKAGAYDGHITRLIKKTEKTKQETVNRVQVYANDIKFSKPEKKGPKNFEISKIVSLLKTNPTSRGVCFVYPGETLDSKWIVCLRFKTAQGYTNFINKLEPKTEVESYVPPPPSSTSSSDSPPPTEKRKTKHISRSLDKRTVYIDTEKLRHLASSRDESITDSSPIQTTFINANKNHSLSLLQSNDGNCGMKRISHAFAVQVDECGRPIHSMPCNVYRYVCNLKPCRTSTGASLSSSLSDISSNSFTERHGWQHHNFGEDGKNMLIKRRGLTHGSKAERRSRSEERAKYYMESLQN